jgi:aerobic carbon-monoxide dehydrogenase small subunit
MRSSVRLRVNGAEKVVETHPLKRLLDVLREDLGLTGTKEGCGEGECGACTVLIDGEAVVSCLIPVGQAEGCEITTIEALRGAHKLQHSFIRHGAAQCGICTPGMIMAALNLPPHATLEQIKNALAGNICRCTGYEAIYRAIQDA